MADDQRAAVVESARAYARDYYLSALLAPRPVRDDLITLAAFEGEIDRIPGSVSDPVLAEIRLQWWRELIENSAPGERSGHPVADALADVITRQRLDRAALVRSIDARSVVDGASLGMPVPSAQARLKALDHAAMVRAARVLGVDLDEEDYGRSVEAAGLALSFARQALATYFDVGRMETPAGGLVLNLKGELQMARQKLDLARTSARSWPKPVRLAALPVALVEPYLRACEGGRRTAGAVAHGGQEAILPLVRVWRLWRFARTGWL